MCAHAHSLEVLDLEMVCSQSLFLGQLFVVGSYVLFEVNVVSWHGRNGNIYEAQCLLCRETMVYSHHVLKKNQIYINGIRKSTKWERKKASLCVRGMKHTELRLTLAAGLTVQWVPCKPQLSSAAGSVLRGTRKEREGHTEGPLDPAERRHAVREAHQNADFAPKSNAGRHPSVSFTQMAVTPVKSSLASPVIFFR